MLVGIRGILKGEVGIGIGDSLGSMVVKSLLFFGVLAIIRPLSLNIDMLKVTIGITIASLAFVMYLSERKEMDWRHGVFLLMVYLCYIAIETMLR
jgi:cation:H+ antiporter